MASRKPQFNVRLTDDWMERLPELARRSAAALGLPEVSIPDVVMMGLALLDEWLAQRQAGRPAEVAGLADPAPTGKVRKRGRPAKEG